MGYDAGLKGQEGLRWGKEERRWTFCSCSGVHGLHPRMKLVFRGWENEERGL